MKYLIIALIGIGVAVLAVALTLAFGKMEIMNDTSMQPTIDHSEHLLVDRVRYLIFSPGRNDIIAFAPNKGERSNVYIRRIIGMPGDTVLIKDGRLYINGELYEDEFSKEVIKNPGIADDEIKVGEDEYFVLGDNRNLSEDSRSEIIGNVMRMEIIGKVWFRTAPFNKAGFI
ncbi:MAG: signal peptidase I [Lachnospiraceae bacterium]|nr:signal peptidase I [Lachnospiraceae bacterium]